MRRSLSPESAFSRSLSVSSRRAPPPPRFACASLESTSRRSTSTPTRRPSWSFEARPLSTRKSAPSHMRTKISPSACGACASRWYLKPKRRRSGGHAPKKPRSISPLSPAAMHTKRQRGSESAAWSTPRNSRVSGPSAGGVVAPGARDSSTRSTPPAAASMARRTRAAVSPARELATSERRSTVRPGRDVTPRREKIFSSFSARCVFPAPLGPVMTVWKRLCGQRLGLEGRAPLSENLAFAGASSGSGKSCDRKRIWSTSASLAASRPTMPCSSSTTSTVSARPRWLKAPWRCGAAASKARASASRSPSVFTPRA
mmetsp:Transcript_1940/g.5723  ORF Transcript_1940/g.5723 Transcript_1940/m.5723 type:complete len:315 (-) Transcript_1940:1450-2394(-)